MRTTPTSTEVGSTSTSDDSAEAIRQLNEMAEEQHRTFEEVMLDPANKELAGRTYTSHHRPSSTSGSELQWSRKYSN
jgi:Ser-tRNA(Ala) deacylase AlaX